VGLIEDVLFSRAMDQIYEKIAALLGPNIFGFYSAGGSEQRDNATGVIIGVVLDNFILGGWMNKEIDWKSGYDRRCNILHWF